jgi:membrane associated rhomboid family serine protease
MATPEQHQAQQQDRIHGVVAIAVMAGIMWVLELIDQIPGADLDQYGIEPRDVDGLPGIVAAPFLHVGFDHLIGNTIPFVALGVIIALNGLVRVLLVTAIVIVIGGLGTWLIAPAGTVHLGASGVVFGYAAYLIARGLFSRSLLQIGVGVIVLALYSTTLLSALVPTPGVSWQSHVFGAVGGVVAAWALDRHRTATDAAARPAPAADPLGLR